jgi:hypothetical protein
VSLIYNIYTVPVSSPIKFTFSHTGSFVKSNFNLQSVECVL